MSKSNKFSDYESLVDKINTAIYHYFDSPSMDMYETAFPITSVICSLLMDTLLEDAASLLKSGLQDFMQTAKADIRGEETGDYPDWDYWDYFDSHALHLDEDDDDDE